MKIALQWVLLISVYAATSFAHAEEPTIQTPSPVIYLADNLDEKDKLGWCIDTVGRGFAERLHTHSCKPRGGDVQFSFMPETGQIVSVEFENYCMANRPDTESTFGLETCDPKSSEQRFSYDADSRELRPSGRPEKCVIVGSNSRSAGPFMSRNLSLADCLDTEASFKEWVIKP